MRRVPHHPGHGCERHHRPGPDAYRRPQDHRRRTVRNYPRLGRCLDRRSADAEAGQQHAVGAAQWRRIAPAVGLHDEPEMNAASDCEVVDDLASAIDIARLSQTWYNPSGLWGTLSNV